MFLDYVKLAPRFAAICVPRWIVWRIFESSNRYEKFSLLNFGHLMSDFSNEGILFAINTGPGTVN